MPVPSTATIAAWFRDAHYRLIGAVGDVVTLRLRQSDGTYQDVAAVPAKVSALQPQQIIAGTSLQVGDLRAIVLARDLPAGMRRLEGRDRVLWRGREYSVVEYDDATDSIGAEVMAVLIFIRG